LERWFDSLSVCTDSCALVDHLVWVTSPFVCSGDHTTCKQLQPITLLASVCLNLLMQLCNQSTAGLSLVLLIRQPITPPLHHWNQTPMSLDLGPSHVGFIRQPITLASSGNQSRPSVNRLALRAPRSQSVSAGPGCLVGKEKHPESHTNNLFPLPRPPPGKRGKRSRPNGSPPPNPPLSSPRARRRRLPLSRILPSTTPHPCLRVPGPGPGPRPPRHGGGGVRARTTRCTYSSIATAS
jgi:hypothetical protein